MLAQQLHWARTEERDLEDLEVEIAEEPEEAEEETVDIEG